MLQAVEGIYRNGTIELLETPTNINESRVLITFLAPPTQQTTTTLMTLGMFKGPQQSTEDDFILAQFQDDREDGLDC